MSSQQSKTLEIVKALNYFSNCELAFLYNLCNNLGWMVHFQGVHFFFLIHTLFLLNIIGYRHREKQCDRLLLLQPYHQPVFQDDQPRFNFHLGLWLSCSYELMWPLHCSKTTSYPLFYQYRVILHFIQYGDILYTIQGEKAFRNYQRMLLFLALPQLNKPLVVLQDTSYIIKWVCSEASPSNYTLAG